MSIRQMGVVWMLPDATSTQKLVLLNIADHANDRGGGAYPKIETIASETSLKKTAIKDALNWARDLWHLSIESGRGKASSQYILTLPPHLLARWDKEHINYGKGHVGTERLKSVNASLVLKMAADCENIVDIPDELQDVKKKRVQTGDSELKKGVTVAQLMLWAEKHPMTNEEAQASMRAAVNDMLHRLWAPVREQAGILLEEMQEEAETQKLLSEIMRGTV